jgi:hypothetical protein
MHEPSFAGTDGERVTSWRGAPPSLPLYRPGGTTPWNPPLCRPGGTTPRNPPLCRPGGTTLSNLPLSGAAWRPRHLSPCSLVQSPRLSWPTAVMAESDKVSGMRTGAEDTR